MKWLLKAIAWLCTLSCPSGLVHFKQVDKGTNGCKINGADLTVGGYMQDANTCGAYTCQNTEGHAFIHYCQIPATFAECVETAVITTIDFPQCCWACASWTKCDDKKDGDPKPASQDANQDPKPDANQDANPAPKPDANPAPKPDTNPAPKPDANPAPKPDANPAPKPDANPAPKPDANPDANPAPSQPADTKPVDDTNSSPKKEGSDAPAGSRTKHKMNEKKDKASLVLPEDLPASKSTSKEDHPASKSTSKEDVPASKTANKPAESKPNKILMPGTKKPGGPRGTDAEHLKFGGRTPITKFGEAPTVDQPSEDVDISGIKLYEAPKLPNKSQGQP